MFGTYEFITTRTASHHGTDSVRSGFALQQ